MARFAREYIEAWTLRSRTGQLTFQLFYSYLLPQYEGITEQDGRELFEQVDAADTATAYKAARQRRSPKFSVSRPIADQPRGR